VKDAWENAKVNGVENAEFIVGEAEKVIPEMYERACARMLWWLTLQGRDAMRQC